MGEMNINYIRELKRNYLTVELSGEQGTEYETRMLADNQITGLLKMRPKYEDGSVRCCYDITSRQPLGRLLENHSIAREELASFLIQLHDILDTMESFLLRESGLLLEPDYIYVEPELFQVGLCFVPGQHCDFYMKLSQLFQYFLKHVDHKDRECVVLAYGLYQESLKENYGLDDLMKLLFGEKNGEVGEQRKEEERSGKQFEPNAWEISGRKKTGQDMELLLDQEKAVSNTGGKAPKGETEAISETTGTVKFFLKQLLVWAVISAALPVVTWILWGRQRLFELEYLLMAAAGGLFLLFALFDVISLLVGMLRTRYSKRIESHNEESELESDENPWRILYEDDEDDGADPIAPASSAAQTSALPTVASPHFQPPPHQQPVSLPRHQQSVSPPPHQQPVSPPHHQPTVSPPPAPELFQTVLLSDCQDIAGLHRLESVSPEAQDIPIPYFPFVIGKHKELADYVITRETVSRFHIRCDKNGDKCTITDLNSTNGTRVKGHLLAANETVEVEPGDSVMIAEMGYIWR